MLAFFPNIFYSCPYFHIWRRTHICSHLQTDTLSFTHLLIPSCVCCTGCHIQSNTTCFVAADISKEVKKTLHVSDGRLYTTHSYTDALSKRKVTVVLLNSCFYTLQKIAPTHSNRHYLIFVSSFMLLNNVSKEAQFSL